MVEVLRLIFVFGVLFLGEEREMGMGREGHLNVLWVVGEDVVDDDDVVDDEDEDDEE